MYERFIKRMLVNNGLMTNLVIKFNVNQSPIEFPVGKQNN